MLVVSAAVAQKPFDRGIHKRTTGGVSFLFGEKKASDAEKMNVVAFDEVVALEAWLHHSLPTTLLQLNWSSHKTWSRLQRLSQ